MSALGKVPHPIGEGARWRRANAVVMTMFCLVGGILGTGCTESEAEVRARKTIAAERARLSVVVTTAAAIRSKAAASAEEARGHGKAFDYSKLSAPVGASLALYRTAEGTPAKDGVALLKGAGDFQVALKAMSTLAPASHALVVEGIKANDTAFAATLGFSRASPPIPSRPCAELRRTALDDVAKENEKIAAKLKAARAECDALTDVFAAVDLNRKNIADSQARNSIDRVRSLQPLFAALSPLVVGAGEVFREKNRVEIKGCAKPELTTSTFLAAIGTDELPPRIQSVIAKTTVTDCKFTIVLPLAPVGIPGSSTPAPSIVGGTK